MNCFIINCDGKKPVAREQLEFIIRELAYEPKELAVFVCSDGIVVRVGIISAPRSMSIFPISNDDAEVRMLMERHGGVFCLDRTCKGQAAQQREVLATIQDSLA